MVRSTLDPDTEGRSTRFSHPPLITAGLDDDGNLFVTVRLSTAVVQVNPYSAEDLRCIQRITTLSRAYSMGEAYESTMRDRTINAVKETDTLPKHVADGRTWALWQLQRTIERLLQPLLLDPPQHIRDFSDDYQPGKTERVIEASDGTAIRVLVTHAHPRGSDMSGTWTASRQILNGT